MSVMATSYSALPARKRLRAATRIRVAERRRRMPAGERNFFRRKTAEERQNVL
jgi:hypothetical protein